MIVANFVGKYVFRLVATVIVLEYLLVACIMTGTTGTNRASLSTKSFISHLCAALLAQAEEEKVEEKCDKAVIVEIADLSKNFSFLSKIHSPHRLVIADDPSDRNSSALFELHCVLLI